MTGSGSRKSTPTLHRQARMIPLFKFITLTFLGFFDLGLPLATLAPDILSMGFGPVMVLTVIGLQSLVTIVSRHRAGIFCDGRGARRTVLVGLFAATIAALLYLSVELWPAFSPAPLIIQLLAARILLGLAESMVLVGSLTWALVALGPGLSWQILALQGAAMHLGLVLGALAGPWLENGFGAIAVPIIVVTIPLLAMLLAASIDEGDRLSTAAQVTAFGVLRRIWQPGLILALATVPLAGMVVLLMPTAAADHWRMPWPAFGALVLGYLCARLVGLCSRRHKSGSLILLISLGTELCGQVLLLRGGGTTVELIGLFLTGLGYSLIFPIEGMVVLRRFEAALHGRAIGGYSAFQDLAIGSMLPATAVMLAWQRHNWVFAIGTVATLAALAIALSNVARNRQSQSTVASRQDFDEDASIGVIATILRFGCAKGRR